MACARAHDGRMQDRAPLARALDEWLAARRGDGPALAAASRAASELAAATSGSQGWLRATSASHGRVDLRTVLVALPRLCPAPARPRPGAWWRQVTCAAMVAARLRPAEAELAAITAALAAAAPIMLAQAMPQALRHADAAPGTERPSALPLWRALALADGSVRLGALAAGLARAWGVHARVAEALDALDDDAELERDPLAAAVVVARWLLALKGMRAPREAGEPEPSARAISRLGLGARGLAEAIAGLSAAADDGRALCGAALAIAARGAPRRRPRAHR
jgi:hypothetical protein